MLLAAGEVVQSRIGPCLPVALIDRPTADSASSETPDKVASPDPSANCCRMGVAVTAVKDVTVATMPAQPGETSMRRPPGGPNWAAF